MSYITVSFLVKLITYIRKHNNVAKLQIITTCLRKIHRAKFCFTHDKHDFVMLNATAIKLGYANFQLYNSTAKSMQNIIAKLLQSCTVLNCEMTIRGICTYSAICNAYFTLPFLTVE